MDGIQSLRYHSARIQWSDDNPLDIELAEQLSNSNDVIETRNVVVTADDVILVEIEVTNTSDRRVDYPLSIGGTLKPQPESKSFDNSGRRYFLREEDRLFGFDTSWKSEQWPVGLCLAIGFTEKSVETELSGEDYRARFRIALAPGESKKLVAACSIAASRGEAGRLIDQALSGDDPSSQVTAAGDKCKMRDPNCVWPSPIGASCSCLGDRCCCLPGMTARIPRR